MVPNNSNISKGDIVAERHRLQAAEAEDAGEAPESSEDDQSMTVEDLDEGAEKPAEEGNTAKWWEEVVPCHLLYPYCTTHLPPHLKSAGSRSTP